MSIIVDIKIKAELLLNNTVNISKNSGSHIYHNIYIIGINNFMQIHKKQHLYYDTIEILLKKSDKINANIINVCRYYDFNNQKYISSSWILC